LRVLKGCVLAIMEERRKACNGIAEHESLANPENGSPGSSQYQDLATRLEKSPLVAPLLLSSSRAKHAKATVDGAALWYWLG